MSFNLNHFLDSFQAQRDADLTRQAKMQGLQDARAQRSAAADTANYFMAPDPGAGQQPPVDLSALAQLTGAGGGQPASPQMPAAGQPMPQGFGRVPMPQVGAAAAQGMGVYGQQPQLPPQLAALAAQQQRSPMAAPQGQPMPGNIQVAPRPTAGAPQMPQRAAPPPYQPEMSQAAAANTPQSQSQDYSLAAQMREAQQSLGTVYQGLRAANPKASPYELSLAAGQVLGDMKGLAPMTKAAMQAQNALLGQQTRAQFAQQKLQLDWANADTKVEQEAALESYHRNLIALGEYRVTSQRDIAAGHDTTRLQAATATISGALDRAILSAKGKERDALIAERGKIRAAQAGMGEAPTYDQNTTPTGDYGASPAPAASGGGVPPQYLGYLKNHRNDKKVVQGYVGQYGKAAVDAALKP